MKALISINACSNEVSFKSDAVASVFENVPAIVGCAVLNKVTPSPEVNVPPGCPLFHVDAPLTFFVLAIDLASAVV